MRSLIVLFAVLFSNAVVFASGTTDSSFTEIPTELTTAKGNIYGTLTLPKGISRMSVALIISGSGPTDRNGNNGMMKNDGLKQLAHVLANAEIASLRFDKRGIAASAAAGKSEADLRFDDYVEDAKSWINLLKNDNRFNRIIVIGHSEGSLIGIIAASGNADKFVSIAGAGRAADVILKEQLAGQPEEIKTVAFSLLDSLKAGKMVTNTEPSLFSLFRRSVQPYMISWFKYEPAAEIKKLTIPVLIVQGTNDLQVSEEDANRLAKAKPGAKLVMVKDMNHVLKIVTGDRAENIKAYNDPSLPLPSELSREIIDFIKLK